MSEHYLTDDELSLLMERVNNIKSYNELIIRANFSIIDLLLAVKMRSREIKDE